MTKHAGRARSILDRSFRYVPSVETDLRKTFARVRRQQRLQARAQSAADVPRGKVAPFSVSLRAVTKR